MGNDEIRSYQLRQLEKAKSLRDYNDLAMSLDMPLICGKDFRRIRRSRGF